MPNPQLSAEVPAPAGDGLTPHTLDQLTMDDPPDGGFRILHRSKEPKPTSRSVLAYCVDHGSKGGYDVTVITAHGAHRFSRDEWERKVRPRTDRIDPPADWARDAWDGWRCDRVAGVQQVLRCLSRPDLDHPKTLHAAAGVDHEQ